MRSLHALNANNLTQLVCITTDLPCCMSPQGLNWLISIDHGKACEWHQQHGMSSLLIERLKQKVSFSLSTQRFAIIQRLYLLSYCAGRRQMSGFWCLRQQPALGRWSLIWSKHKIYGQTGSWWSKVGPSTEHEGRKVSPRSSDKIQASKVIKSLLQMVKCIHQHSNWSKNEAETQQPTVPSWTTYTFGHLTGEESKHVNSSSLSFTLVSILLSKWNLGWDISASVGIKFSGANA